jgi:hypothetical protein
MYERENNIKGASARQIRSWALLSWFCSTTLENCFFRNCKLDCLLSTIKECVFIIFMKKLNWTSYIRICMSFWRRSIKFQQMSMLSACHAKHEQTLICPVVESQRKKIMITAHDISSRLFTCKIKIKKLYRPSAKLTYESYDIFFFTKVMAFSETEKHISPRKDCNHESYK